MPNQDRSDLKLTQILAARLSAMSRKNRVGKTDKIYKGKSNYNDTAKRKYKVDCDYLDV